MTGASLDGVGEVVMRVCEVGVKWEATARGRQSASGQKQPVAYLRWADCFKLTTVIGTLIKTVAGR